MPSAAARTLASDLTPAAVHEVLAMCPIGVTEADGASTADYSVRVRYGFRTAQIARAVLDPEDQIEATLHVEESDHLAARHLLDRLVLPVLLGPPHDDATIQAWVAAMDNGALQSDEAMAMGLRIRSPGELKKLLGIHGRKLSEARSAIDEAPSDG